MYLRRVAETTAANYLSTFPALGITGPRQSGKSTMLKEAFKNYHYVTFDSLENIEYFETDPKGFMKQYNNRVIFDEVQYVPKIFNYIKLAIDEDRQNVGKFILTGSNQFSHLKNASESLAGRIGLMSLLPLQYSEMPEELHRNSICKGAYPELVLSNYRNSSLWYSSYLETYLNKDVRQLSNIGNMRDFKRFISLLAANVSSLLDMSSYARNLGVSVTTIKRWLSILEASYIIFLIPPYYNNLGKRIIKSPKIYFYDTGLVSHLTGIKTFDQYDKGPLSGPLFENYIISEIFKKNLHRATDAELFYFRTADKAEIDLIVDFKSKSDFIEIKKTSTFSPKFSRSLINYTLENSTAYILYQGEGYHYKESINVINYQEYLKD